MANQMQGDGAVNPVINGEENTNAKKCPGNNGCR